MAVYAVPQPLVRIIRGCAIARRMGGEKWIRHHATRVMHPEALYDSLSVVLQPPMRKGRSGQIVKAMPLPGLARTDFTRFFATRPDQNLGSAVNQGIPQILSLLNGPLLNQTLNPQALLRPSATAGNAVDVLYLAAYARRPAPEERRLIEASFSAGADSAGLLAL